MDLSVFDAIARQNTWGSTESVSGPGSTLDATTTLRKGLVEAFPALGIRSLVDAPCGDLNWMRHVQFPFDRYIGIDIVPAVIDRLKAQAFPPAYHFQVGNIVTDILPAADALLCRDCLVHLPFAAIEEAARLWKMAGFRFVMTTTFTEHGNEDCAAGGWRPLNMQAAPFNWPIPDMLIPDNDGLGPPFNDKSLGVWRL